MGSVQWSSGVRCVDEANLRVVVNFEALGGEEGDGGLAGQNIQIPLIGPIMDPDCLEHEGWGCITVIAGGD